MTGDEGIVFQPINIRFDGLDAEQHKIDLAAFGKSAQGLSKTMATVADFVITGNYRKRKRKPECKILIGSAKDNCISFEAIIQAIDNKELATAGLAFASGFAGALTANIATDIYRGVFKLLWSLMIGKKDTESDKKRLRKALAQVSKDQKRIDKLLAVIEKMADGLSEPAKQVVHPINISCKTIKFGDTQNNYFLTLGASDKEALLEREYEYTDLAGHRVIISEVDMKKKSCMVSLQDDLKRRFKAEIHDPQIEKANNDYGIAMNSKRIVVITAKQKLFKDEIQSFIISDIQLPKL